MRRLIEKVEPYAFVLGPFVAGIGLGVLAAVWLSGCASPPHEVHHIDVPYNEPEIGSGLGSQPNDAGRSRVGPAATNAFPTIPEMEGEPPVVKLAWVASAARELGVWDLILNAGRHDPESALVKEGDGWVVIWRTDGQAGMATVPVGSKWYRGWDKAGPDATHRAVVVGYANGDGAVFVEVPE